MKCLNTYGNVAIKVSCFLYKYKHFYPAKKKFQLHVVLFFLKVNIIYLFNKRLHLQKNIATYTGHRSPSVPHSYCQHLSLSLCFVVTVLEREFFHLSLSGSASSAGTLPPPTVSRCILKCPSLPSFALYSG